MVLLAHLISVCSAKYICKPQNSVKLVKLSMSIYYDLETRGISYLCPLNCFVNFSIIWFNMNCILQIVFSVLMTTINKLPKSQNT